MHLVLLTLPSGGDDAVAAKGRRRKSRASGWSERVRLLRLIAADGEHSERARAAAKQLLHAHLTLLAEESETGRGQPSRGPSEAAEWVFRTLQIWDQGSEETREALRRFMGLDDGLECIREQVETVKLTQVPRETNCNRTVKVRCIDGDNTET